MLKYYRDSLCMSVRNCVEIQRLSRLRIRMQICFRKLAGIYRVLRTVHSRIGSPAKWLEHIFPKRASLPSFSVARGLQLAYVLHFVIYVAWFLHASSCVRARSPLFHPFRGLLCSTYLQSTFFFRCLAESLSLLYILLTFPALPSIPYRTIE